MSGLRFLRCSGDTQQARQPKGARADDHPDGGTLGLRNTDAKLLNTATPLVKARAPLRRGALSLAGA
eukprot:2441448-Pyramimonas_sp.AAC.1